MPSGVRVAIFPELPGNLVSQAVPPNYLSDNVRFVERHAYELFVFH